VNRLRSASGLSVVELVVIANYLVRFNDPRSVNTHPFDKLRETRRRYGRQWLSG
jgi:hypothetical protein